MMGRNQKITPFWKLLGQVWLEPLSSPCRAWRKNGQTVSSGYECPGQRGFISWWSAPWLSTRTSGGVSVRNLCTPVTCAWGFSLLSEKIGGMTVCQSDFFVSQVMCRDRKFESLFYHFRDVQTLFWGRMKFQFLPENFSRSENAPPFETRKIRQFEVERIFLENKKMVHHPSLDKAELRMASHPFPRAKWVIMFYTYSIPIPLNAASEVPKI